MADAFSALVEASYDGIGFPVTSAPVEGGHDSVEHRAYLRRGSVIEPTGLKAYRGTLVIPLVNTDGLVRRYGTLFPDLLERLRLKFQDRPIGRLVHPLLGPLEAHVASWPVELTAEDRGGARMTLSWVENVASVADANFAPDQGDSVEQVQRRADTADAAVAVVAPGTPSLRESVDAATELAATDGSSHEEVRAAFAELDDAITATLALDELREATASSIAALTAVERLRDSSFTLREQYLRRSEAREYIVPVSGMSVADLALEVYGSLDGIAKLVAANALVSTEIRPGRRLVLPR